MQFVDAVEVKVVHWVSVCAQIFVYNCKGRRSYRVCDSENLADCSSECRLAGTHGGKECHEGVFADFFKEFLRSAFQVLYIFDDYFVFHGCKDM